METLKNRVSYQPIKGELNILLSTDSLEQEIVASIPQWIKTEDITRMFLSRSAALMRMCEGCPLRRREFPEKGRWFSTKTTWKGLCSGFKRGFTSDYISAGWDKTELSELTPTQVEEELKKAKCQQ